MTEQEKNIQFEKYNQRTHLYGRVASIITLVMLVGRKVSSPSLNPVNLLKGANFITIIVLVLIIIIIVVIILVVRAVVRKVRRKKQK